MFTLSFWRDAIERAVRSVAQVVIGLLTADSVLNILNVDVKAVVGVAGLALVLSLLNSIVALPFGKPDSASFLDGRAS